MKVDKMKLNLLMANSNVNFTKLAIISGVSRATLSYINNGKQCRPEVARKIADALGVSIETLIDVQ